MDDLRLLRSFLEVVNAGSMAEAANSIGCSASAISQQISRLETELDVDLLSRHNQGVFVTPAGAELVTQARRLLGVMTDLEKTVGEVATQQAALVRLAAFSSITVHLLPQTVHDFRKRLPEGDISLIEKYDNTYPFDVLLSGEVDLVIAHEFDHVPLAFPEGIDVEFLGHDEMEVVMPQGHPLSKKKKIKLTDMRDESWVLFPEGHLTTVSILHETENFGFIPKCSFRAIDYQVVCALVSGGLGISLLPKMITSKLQWVCDVRPLDGVVFGRSVWMATRSGTKTKAVSELKEIFLGLFKDDQRK